MIRIHSAIKSIFIATLISVFLANGAQAVDPVRQYQIDVVPIANSRVAVEVTEEVSRQIIAQVDSAFNDATGGQIRFTFRKLHPISYPKYVPLSPGGIQEATGLTPIPDKGFDGAILVGVITKTSTAGFSGIAEFGGDYVIMNGIWAMNDGGPQVLRHELGHTLGLKHANSAVCTTQLPIVCEQSEYGDNSSTMGIPKSSRFSATELDKLKVLPKESRAIATESGDYKLAPVYSKGINLPKVLYIPIGNELTYSVEYRPAVGNDSSLSMTQIVTPSGGYYNNTPSGGLQLRILKMVGTQFKDLQPTLTNYKDLETALVVPTLTGDQTQPIGKVFTLSDGSTLTFLSADPITGATVRVQRSPDKDAPLALSAQAWSAQAWWVIILGKEKTTGNRTIYKKNFDTWDYPVIEIPVNSVTDNRLIKLVQIEVNGEVVGQIDTPSLNQIENYYYQTTKDGRFTLRLIATDFAGLSTATQPTSLSSIYNNIISPDLRISSGKDPRTSLTLIVEPSSEKTKYVLDKLSSGKIASIVEKSGRIEYAITNITRNQKFTALLTGTDEMGYTDWGSEIKYEPETTGCTNKQCFVGYQWTVDTGLWVTGAGNMTLQERIGSKWVNIQTAKPVADPKSTTKKYVTYVMKVNYQTPGKHTYRLSIADSKKYSGRITSTFTQVVLLP
jgi:hypothetical protein